MLSLAKIIGSFFKHCVSYKHFSMIRSSAKLRSLGRVKPFKISSIFLVLHGLTVAHKIYRILSSRCGFGVIVIIDLKYYSLNVLFKGAS